MSLDTLRAEAEAEDTKVKEPEYEAPDDVGTNDELATDVDDLLDEPEETEASDDFELELEGEPEPQQQKYDPVAVLQHKFSREKKKRQSKESEIDELKEQIAQLTKAMQSGAQSQPAAQKTQSVAEPNIPDLYDQGIEGDRQKYDRAMKKWFADYQAFQNRDNEAQQVQQKQDDRIKQLTRGLAERVSKFAIQEKIKPEYVADAVNNAADKFDELTGIEGSFLDIMDAVGDGGERVALYVGKNANAMSEIARLFHEDRRGFKVVRQMTEWKRDLIRKKSKQLSGAPEPDQSIKGNGSPASSRKLQEMYDKASETSNLKEMREAQRLAEQRGVKLK
jgi:hypothetical protein